MSVSKKKMEQIREYNNRKYDKLIIYIPKGKKDVYRSCAEKSGFSLNKFMNIAAETLFDDIENGNSL